MVVEETDRYNINSFFSNTILIVYSKIQKKSQSVHIKTNNLEAFILFIIFSFKLYFIFK